MAEAEASSSSGLIGELNSFFLEFRRILSSDLLCDALAGCGNFSRHLFANAELITLNAEHGDPLRQAIQDLAKAKRLRQAEPVTGKMLRMWQSGRTAFPHVYRACGSTGHNRVNQDEVFIIVPTRNQFECPASLNLSRDPELA